MPVDNREPNLRSSVRGRPFEKGNGGRRPGSKNRTTHVAEALLEGEEVDLVRKAIELAKAGDIQMLKFLLDRILPKERPVHVDLPVMRQPADAIDALALLMPWVLGGLRRVRLRPWQAWSGLMLALWMSPSFRNAWRTSREIFEV